MNLVFLINQAGKKYTRHMLMDSPTEAIQCTKHYRYKLFTYISNACEYHKNNCKSSFSDKWKFKITKINNQY